MKVEDVILDTQDDGSGSWQGDAPIHVPAVLCTSFIPVPVSRSNWLEMREVAELSEDGGSSHHHDKEML